MDEDAWLAGRAATGDLGAFEVLVERHRDRIHRIALRMLGDRGAAEDVTQDVVLQLWTGLAAFTGSASFTTWLHRVVVNRCTSRLRRHRPSAPLPEDGERGHPPAAGVETRVQDRAELAAATAAVARLPDEQRSVFVLCQLEGRSDREVAAVHHISEAAVRGRLCRARENLLHAMREWS